MSGSIWADWEDYTDHSDYSDYTDYTDVYTPEKSGGNAKCLTDVILKARDGFAERARGLQQELMRLIGAVSALGAKQGGEMEALIESACCGVFALSGDITNESENDMFAICDLLAISLAATSAEKASYLAFEDDIVEKDIPYLSKAFAALANYEEGMI